MNQDKILLVTLSVIINDQRETWSFSGKKGNIPTLCAYAREKREGINWIVDYNWDGMSHRVTDLRPEKIPEHIEKMLYSVLENKNYE